MKNPVHPEITSGKNVSCWTDTVSPLLFEKLMADADADVVIVGGGIAGISIAYCLSLEGRSVVVVEDGAVGSGETGRTTAHLVTALDNRYYDLRRMYGEEHTRQIADSHAQAIESVANFVRREKIMCDFRTTEGYLFLHPNDDPSSLDKELDAARNAGLTVEPVDQMPGIRDGGPALRFSGQATFHPLKYLAGLCKAILEKGGKIFTDTHAKDITSEGITATNGFRVKAKHIVVATNSPVNIQVDIHLKQYPYRTYVVGGLVKKGSVPDFLWWDTGDPDENSSIPPYHYIRTAAYDDVYDLLICGGEDHPTGLPDVPEEYRYARLEEWASDHFPVEAIAYRWSGQVEEPMDGLAFIGRHPSSKEDNMYIVTGDSGNGMTHGALSGLLITDMIMGRENPWEKIYDPSRFKLLRAGGTFFRELTGMVLQYYKTKPRDASSIKLQSIRPGTGDIIALDGHSYGAYKDETGLMHLVDAECTHLGCIIHWNNDEKTWDCPCHGSRFGIDGKVLNGPANTNLPYYMEGAKHREHIEH